MTKSTESKSKLLNLLNSRLPLIRWSKRLTCLLWFQLAHGLNNSPKLFKFQLVMTMMTNLMPNQDYLTLPWKLLFAFVPPTDYCGGWICFVVSIIGVGVLTAFIGDFAAHFGCTVGVTDAITAISFVALGTSVPDTFASKTAAIGDDTADASVGNVTGSNAVNVFLGIGLAWTFAAFYWFNQGLPGLPVKEGTLTFSVIIFCVEALIAIVVLLFRRRYGGELGGPRGLKIASSLFFVFLWFFYLALSIAKAYCKI